MWQSIDRIIGITKRLLFHFLNAHQRWESYWQDLEPINKSQKSTCYTCDIIECVDVYDRLALLVLRHSWCTRGKSFQQCQWQHEQTATLLTWQKCPFISFNLKKNKIFFPLFLKLKNTWINWLFCTSRSASVCRLPSPGTKYSDNKLLPYCINYFRSNTVGTISNLWRKSCTLTLKYISVAATSF